MIQALLKFDDIEFLLSGFLKLSTNHIMSFVSCGPGSHIIDSFFKLENIQLGDKIKLLEHILNVSYVENLTYTKNITSFEIFSFS